MIIKENDQKRRHIHILKFDIESSELDFFKDFFQSASTNQGDLPHIHQIQFEMCLMLVGIDEPCVRTHKLFELIR